MGQWATWAGRDGSPVTGHVRQGVVRVQPLVTSLPVPQAPRHAGGTESLDSGRHSWDGLEVKGKGHERTLFKSLPTKRPWVFLPSVCWHPQETGDTSSHRYPPLLGC